MKIGWIGVGRMGAPMAVRLLRAGLPVSIWNRTRAKAQTEELQGAVVVDAKAELAEVDVLFTMLSTRKDVIDVCFGPDGIFRDPNTGRNRKILVDCSTIGMVRVGGNTRSRLENTRRAVPRCSGQRQPEMRSRGQVLLRGFGAEASVRRG